jgi:hypothetical protein
MAFSFDVVGKEGQELVMISLDGLELVMVLELQSLADALGGVAGDDANQSAS